ncbi:MAG: glucose-1-phosphate cytidylyltransferase [Holophaga sp.]|nr:glucose-1-phosphate cytidylyltransferase [Holophaga sp.]
MTQDIKTVILAGGLGTRLTEETTVKPKPMVEIGGQPILWHIMNLYAAHGFREFLIALGYKGDMIKRYFLEFHAMSSNLSLDLAKAETRYHAPTTPPWKVHLIETGSQTMTGGRIRRMRQYLGDDPLFMVTYGDGVADLDLKALVAFHRSHGKLATVTAVRPPARFGEIRVEDGLVKGFAEKPQVGAGWINGGFFVLDRKVLDYIQGDDTIWEREPMERLVAEGQLMAYCHEGFWHPMDTLRERNVLESLWNSGKAPWKNWD